MASSPAIQILDTAIDQHGLSVSTAVRSPTDPRPGSVYDNVNIAAAVPIWFHPMTSPSLGGDNFMMLTSQRWTDATPLSTNPGFSSTYTADTTPSWALVNAANGTVTALNSGFAIPMAGGVTNPTLVGAASRGTNFLYALHSTDQGALVQQWHNNAAINVLTPVNQEIIPVASCGSDVITFDAGVQYDAGTDPYMIFYGIGSVTKRIYMARKAWSRVGDIGATARPTDGIWEFFNGTGWVRDPAMVHPVMSDSGPIVAAGPLSFAHYAIARTGPGKLTHYALMAVTQASGSAYSSQVYSSLGGRPWSALGAPVSLGSAGTTYLGGALQLQGHLGPNPAMVDTASSATAIPYVVATKQASGSAHQIALSWGLIQVPRHR